MARQNQTIFGILSFSGATSMLHWHRYSTRATKSCTRRHLQRCTNFDKEDAKQGNFTKIQWLELLSSVLPSETLADWWRSHLDFAMHFGYTECVLFFISSTRSHKNAHSSQEFSNFNICFMLHACMQQYQHTVTIEISNFRPQKNSYASQKHSMSRWSTDNRNYPRILIKRQTVSSGLVLLLSSDSARRHAQVDVQSSQPLNRSTLCRMPA